MAVKVLISASLRSFTDRVPEFSAEGSTIKEVFDSLTDQYPDVLKGVFDEDGEIRGYVNVYINDKNIYSLKGLKSEVKDGDFVLLIPAIAGGSQEAEKRESVISKDRMKEVALDNKQIERYSNHLQLREINVKGQKRIMAAKVLVAGLGALGGVVVNRLAAAGVGTIGIVDFDEVSVSNLQSQTTYGTRDVGRPKAAATKDSVKKMNPLVNTVAYQEKLTADNVEDIIADYDVVVDATDNFVSRYLISDACVLAGKPEVFGAMYQFEGFVTILGESTGPCYRCLYPSPPPVGLVPTCSEAGVASPLPGVVGGLMATEVLKLLTGTGTTLSGKAISIDTWNLRTNYIETVKDAGCPVCGKHRTLHHIEEIDYEDFCGLKGEPDEEPIEGIEGDELAARIASGEPITIVDVREPHERSILRFPGAITIPIGQLARRQKELDPGIDTIFVCREGKRSILAIRTLREAGYEGPMYNLKGGLDTTSHIIFPNEGAWL